MESNEPGILRHALETDKGIFAYRIITSAGAVICTTMLGFVLTYMAGMSKDVTQIRIDAALASGKADLINQRVSDVVGRVDIHAIKIERLDTRIWSLETHKGVP